VLENRANKSPDFLSHRQQVAATAQWGAKKEFKKF
jgi:hypothetical protein